MIDSLNVTVISVGEAPTTLPGAGRRPEQRGVRAGRRRGREQRSQHHEATARVRAEAGPGHARIVRIGGGKGSSTGELVRTVRYAPARSTPRGGPSCPLHPRAGQARRSPRPDRRAAGDLPLLHRAPRPVRDRAAGGVRHVRAPRLQPAHRLQRGPHRRDHPGHLRVPAAQGTDGPLFLGRTPTRSPSRRDGHRARGVRRQRRHRAARRRRRLHADARRSRTRSSATTASRTSRTRRRHRASPRRTTRRATAASSTTRRNGGPADTDATSVDRGPGQRHPGRRARAT